MTEGQSAEIRRTASEPAEREELTAEDIIGAKDIIEELVHVPEWATGNRAYVRVRALTGRERDAFEASVIGSRGGDQSRNLQNLRARLCALSIVKPDGTRMFSQQQIAMLGEKSAAALNRVWAAAQRLSGLSDEEVDELSAGFGDGQSGPSTSD